MPRARWKDAEDRLANLFGCKRRPLSGSNSRSGGCDDCNHPRLYLENKYGKYVPLYRLYLETRELARKEGKIPVIGLQAKNQKGILLVLHESDLAAVYHEAQARLAPPKPLKVVAPNGKSKQRKTAPQKPIQTSLPQAKRKAGQSQIKP